MADPSNKIVILDNKKCRITLSDPVLFKKLHNFLSFKPAGIEYSPYYQNSNWNGVTYLLSKNGSFSLGLLTKVENFLYVNGVVAKKEDRRLPVFPAKEIDLSNKLVQLNMVPRYYQNDIVKVAIANRKGIVRACTGSGKTLATALISAVLNKPTIIYVIGLDLLKQFHDLFSSLFDEPIGYIGDGICQIERINIATIWTIGSALRVDKKKIILDDENDDEEKIDDSQYEKITKLLETTKVHIFDESHVITTDTIKAIHKIIDPEYIYGFSGTPFRSDNTDLLIHSILGEQIINVNASQLIIDGYLAQPIIKFVDVPKMKIDTSNYQSVYKNYIVENEVRNKLIVKNTQMLLDKKYTPLVLFKQIRHGEILLEMMQGAGIKCEMLYGNDSLDKRTEIKQKLIDKEIDVILSSTIFDIGLDLPILSGLVLCGGGKSNIRSLQRVGRVIRIIPGKKHAAIIDFHDNIKYLKKHSRIRCDTYLSEEGFKVIKCLGMK